LKARLKWRREGWKRRRKEKLMEIREAVQARQSIRAFQRKPVPRAVLERVLEGALRAPSWGNTQPWQFTVVGGEVLEKIREECVALASRGVMPEPELAFPSSFDEPLKSRYKGLGRGLYDALGIAREDKAARNAHFMEMMGFFGAPNLLYLHFRREFNHYAFLDGGLILQTIALLALEERLGTCILAVSVGYPQVVRKYAEIPEDQVLVMGVALGYPQPDHPANRFRSDRGKLEEFVRFVGVEG